MSSKSTIHAIRIALSTPRFDTYENAVVVSGDAGPAALALYDWNAQISGAFMAPLHICEVVIRNAVSEALTAVYGVRWPWSPVFEASLPSPDWGYNPRRDLQRSRQGQFATHKVIPELKFVFWQKMFTVRYEIRIWNLHLRGIMPNSDSGKTVSDLRKEIYADLEYIRLLRNRIAHHEPIFRRNLAEDLVRIEALIQLRCKLTAEWMMANQRITNASHEWFRALL